MKKINFKLFGFLLVLVITLQSCLPKEQVVFKSVTNLSLDAGTDGNPLLKGEAIFYNPNKLQTKLKEINVDVLVDGKKTATVDQKMDLVVLGKSDFTVPIEAKLSLQELGLLDTVLAFLGGKSYKIQFAGYVRVAVHGVTFKVPVKYNEEVKLK
jgi:LEA14-like dessication related protein